MEVSPQRNVVPVSSAIIASKAVRATASHSPERWTRSLPIHGKNSSGSTGKYLRIDSMAVGFPTRIYKVLIYKDKS